MRMIEKNNEEKRRFSDDFIQYRKLVYPIIIAGKYDNAIPDRLSTKVAIDISDIAIYENKSRLTLTSTWKSRHRNQFIKLLDEMYSVSTRKSIDFKIKYDELAKDLFFNTKQEQMTNEVPENILVETRAYKRIENQSVYFLVGRKGSGKSTVVSNLQRFNKKKYKGVVEIIADAFDLETTYHNFIKDAKYSSDIKTQFSQTKALRLLWRLFIYIYSMYVVYNERDNLTEGQKKYIAPIIAFYKGLLSGMNRHEVQNNKTVSSVLYTYSREKLVQFIDSVISRSGEYDGLISTDIEKFFQFDKLINFAVGETESHSFKKIIGQCTKKILISLDGFDSDFENFRQETETYFIKNNEEFLSRRSFETKWLYTLLNEFMLCKTEKNPPLSGIVDLCITIPMDRFYEIKQTMRDFFRLDERISSINWSGLELARIVIKRLEHLFDYNTDKRQSEEKRLSTIHEKKIPSVPNIIEIVINGAKHEMSLYQYILRMSFWRPRDILKYYTVVLTLLNEKRGDEKIRQGVIKRLIKEKSMNIINDEFIAEFVYQYDNIKNVINCFSGVNQLVSFVSIKKLLRDTKFSIMHSQTMSAVDKVQILYDIGFLGVVTHTNHIDSMYTHKYAFVFNEGQTPMLHFLNNQNDDFHFVINCIFTEYLDLILKTDELICNYDWKYLADNDRVSGLLNGIRVK